MTNINVEIHDDVMDIINKIRNIPDPGLTLSVPEGALIFENIVNIRLLEREAERLGKTLNIQTDDENGQRLLTYAHDEKSSDFTSRRMEPQTAENISAQPGKRKFAFALPSLNLKKPSLKKSKVKAGHRNIAIAAVVLILAGGFGGYKVFADKHTADIVIDVKSQPLTKSIQITVDSTQNTSAEQKILKGHVVETLISEKATVETTGEKLVGEAATGKVIIYNKTTSSKKFDKGTELVADKEDLEYVLDETVTVPARTEKMEGINIVITPGAVEAKIKASEIGDKYNIGSEEEMEVDDYSKSEVSARTQGRLTGGKSETIKVVTEEDKTKVKTETAKVIQEVSGERLANAVLPGRKFIAGSDLRVVKGELYSAEVDDEADQLELTEEVSISGLSYATKDLEELVSELLDEFIPEGYTLSSKEMSINAEVLGTTEKTVLSPTKADLQVTIKTYVITDIKEEDVKKSLSGKSLKDGQAILDKIQNINNYSVNIGPNMPFLKNFPRNIENINVEIKRS